MSDEHEVVFRWPSNEPNTVVVTGTFDKWTASCLLKKGLDGFEGSVSIPWDEKVTYKFIVDGKWMVHEHQPTEADHDGNINNVYTAPPKPTESTPTPKAVEPTSKDNVESFDVGSNPMAANGVAAVDQPSTSTEGGTVTDDGPEPLNINDIPFTADGPPAATSMGLSSPHLVSDLANTVAAREGTPLALGDASSGLGAALSTVVRVDPINASQIAVPTLKYDGELDVPEGYPLSEPEVVVDVEPKMLAPEQESEIVLHDVSVVIVPVNTPENNTSVQAPVGAPKLLMTDLSSPVEVGEKVAERTHETRLVDEPSTHVVVLSPSGAPIAGDLGADNRPEAFGVTSVTPVSDLQRDGTILEEPIISVPLETAVGLPTKAIEPPAEVTPAPIAASPGDSTQADSPALLLDSNTTESIQPPEVPGVVTEPAPGHDVGMSVHFSQGVVAAEDLVSVPAKGVAQPKPVVGTPADASEKPTEVASEVITTIGLTPAEVPTFVRDSEKAEPPTISEGVFPPVSDTTATFTQGQAVEESFQPVESVAAISIPLLEVPDAVQPLHEKEALPSSEPIPIRQIMLDAEPAVASPAIDQANEAEEKGLNMNGHNEPTLVHAATERSAAEPAVVPKQPFPAFESTSIGPSSPSKTDTTMSRKKKTSIFGKLINVFTFDRDKEKEKK